MSPGRFWRIVRQRLRSLLRRREVDAELESELALHIDFLTAERMSEGVPEAEARAEARRLVGNLTRITEDCRETRRVGWIGDLFQDAVYGVRLLRAHPAVTVTAALSLALGIGATAAAIRGIDAVRAGILGVPDADRYVVVQTVSPTRELKGASAIDIVAWRDRSQVFDLLGASMNMAHVIGADAYGPAERLTGLVVTPAYFETTGIRPLLGRVFTREESRLVDPAPAVIISEAFWRGRFAADPDVLSRRLTINRRPTPIVGVMPDTMRFRDLPVEIWQPLRLMPTRELGSGRALRVHARLAPGITIESAREQLNAVAASVGQEFGEGFSGWTVSLTTLDDARLGWSVRPLTILTAIAVLVLVIACANVAGLLIARASARHDETRLRLDLGASRGRLVRQWLTEGLVLGLCGGAVSLLVARLCLWGVTMLQPPPGAPAIAPIPFDWRLAAVTAGLAVFAGLGLSLVPALVASARQRAAAGWPRLRGLVTAVQIAVTIVVLIGTGLLLNSLVRLNARDLGFEPTGLMTFEVVVPSTRRQLGWLGSRQYFEVTSRPADTLAEFEDAFRRVPNVVSVGGSSFRAIDAFVIPRFDVSSGSEIVKDVASAFVTSNYFRTLRATIVHGRDLDESDSPTSAWVALVNENLAARLWPGENAIGKVLRVNTVPEDPPRIVIGVVRDIPLGNGRASDPVVYASFRQQPARCVTPWINLFGTMTFVVRHNGRSEGLAEAIGRAAAGVSPEIPLGSVSLVTERLAAGRARLSRLVRLASMLALTAGLLAVIGIHGIVAYGVRRERRQLAVRMALGATPAQVVGFVAARTAPMIVAGLGTGVPAALIFSQFLGPYLWGVTPGDPLTYVAACGAVALLAALACVAPTRSALDVNPSTALRVE